MKVLVLCNEHNVAEDVINSLRMSYVDLEIVTSASFAITDIDKIDSYAFDIVVIDLDIAKNIFDVIRRIRSLSNTVIIGLCSNKKGILKALNTGADQCLVKPFGYGEFIARIKAVLRIRGVEITKSIG